jgi:hypothetical protein
MGILSRVEEESRLEYPKIGEPLKTNVMVSSSKYVERWQPHIIDTKTTGRFLNYWVESEWRAWEIAMQKVVEIRKNLANLRRK